MFTWQISKHWSAHLWILRRAVEVTGYSVHPPQCQENFTVFFHVLCNCRYKFCVHRKHVLPQDFAVRSSERRGSWRVVETAALIQNSKHMGRFPSSFIITSPRSTLLVFFVSICVFFPILVCAAVCFLVSVFVLTIPHRRRCTVAGLESKWRLAVLIVECDDHFLSGPLFIFRCRFLSFTVFFFFFAEVPSPQSLTSLSSIVALEFEISPTESQMADISSSSKSNISAKSNEIEESISQSWLSFTIKPFLLFTKSPSSMKRTSTCNSMDCFTVITTEIMRTSQETNFRRRK